MKNVFLTIIALMTINNGFATDRNYNFSQVIDENVAQLSELSISAMKSDKYAVCQAITQCMNGRVITCQTFGMGCSWYVQQAQYVSCTGYNSYGQWVNFNASCY